MAHTALSLIAALASASVVFGFEPSISARLIEEALGIGQSRIESVHTRFHQPYRLQIARAPFDYIDVITPVRRVVLLAEERSRLGIRGFTQNEAATELGASAQVVELRVEMTFHPQNVFIGVPAYEVTLVGTGRGGRLMAGTLERIPRFGPRIEGAPTIPIPNGPPGGQPLTGGTVIATFAVGAINGTGTYEVVITESDKELARTRVDFSALR